MVDRPALSKGEMEVARVLWETGPATVRAVHDALSKVREIDFATVQTYLRRLQKKGYVASTLDGRVRVYASRAKAHTVIRDTVNDLIERLFGGDSMPLVRHLVNDRRLDEHDLHELRDLIDRLEAEQGNAK